MYVRVNRSNTYGFTLGDIWYSHSFQSLPTPFPSNGLSLMIDYEGYFSRHRWLGTASLETFHWQPLLCPAWMATQICDLIFRTERSWDMRLRHWDVRLRHCCSAYGEEKAFIALHYVSFRKGTYCFALCIFYGGSKPFSRKQMD